jgi:hypothetical protein
LEKVGRYVLGEVKERPLFARENWGSTIWLTVVISHPQHGLSQLSYFTATSVPTIDLAATSQVSSLRIVYIFNVALQILLLWRCGQQVPPKRW